MARPTEGATIRTSGVSDVRSTRRAVTSTPGSTGRWHTSPGAPNQVSVHPPTSATRTGGLAHVATDITGFGVRYALELLLHPSLAPHLEAR